MSHYYLEKWSTRVVEVEGPRGWHVPCDCYKAARGCVAPGYSHPDCDCDRHCPLVTPLPADFDFDPQGEEEA